MSCNRRFRDRLLVLGATLSLLLNTATPATGQAVTSGTSEPGNQIGPPGPVNRVSATPVPRMEIFGGYSYLPESGSRVMEAGHGFALALDMNFGPHFGLRADFDANLFARHAERAPAAIGGYELTREDITLYFYSVGPRFVQRWKRVNVFGEGLLEGQTSKWDGYSQVMPGATSGAEDVPCLIAGRPNLVLPCTVPGHTSSAFGLGVGGGLDARVGERFAIRVLQINYFLGWFGGGPDRNLRLKTGVVFGFR